MAGTLLRAKNWLRSLWKPKPLGRRGEAAAARYLRRRRYKILRQSESFGPGELDLVALKDGQLVFVEVKTRHSANRGHPVEAVDANKQRRLTRLAVTFMKRHGLLEMPARFDIVAVIWPEGVRRPTIEHFPNAFDCDGTWEFYS